MKLKEHIFKSGLNVTEYAQAVGVSAVTIYNALKGSFSPDTAQKIFDHSGGKVVLIIRPMRKDFL